MNSNSHSRLTQWPNSLWPKPENVQPSKRPASTSEEEPRSKKKTSPVFVTPIKQSTIQQPFQIQKPQIYQSRIHKEFQQSPLSICTKYMELYLKFGIAIKTFLVLYNEEILILGIIHNFNLDNKLESVLSSQHKNLVQVQDAFIFEQDLYTFSEYMDISLSRLIACRRLEEIEIATIIKQVTKRTY